MDEAREAESKKSVTLRPGARVRFHDPARGPRVQAETHTVVAVDERAQKVRVRHNRPRDHAYAYLFWYDANDIEEETDGPTTADSP